MTQGEQECIPCSQAGQKMSRQEAETLLRDVPGWELSVDGNAILRNLKFRNFKQALECVNRIGVLAEEQKHHPDIVLGWGYVRLTLQTHSIGGLHANDFILAGKINNIL